MNPSEHPVLRCPVCTAPLRQSERSFLCENGHHFDLAKEGYINLLLSHQRRSKTPGDDKAMIQARRRFMDSGAWDPLADAIQNLFPREAANTLDCGCGEGRFLGALSEEYSGHFFGIDVSKDAVRAASKRYKKALWIVANGMRELPLMDNSINCILSVLAPRNIVEFNRILRPDGTLILGVPGPNHLIELRSQLQAHSRDFEEKADQAVETCAPQFSEQRRDAVHFEVTLNREQIRDLIQMTPIFWNSSPEAKETVCQLDTLCITASFILISLKQSDPARHNPE
jgi:23S rRNA (guanine745-N1)-methyltransferase